MGAVNRKHATEAPEPARVEQFSEFRVTIAVRDHTDSALFKMSHESRPVDILARFTEAHTAEAAARVIGATLFGHSATNVYQLANAITFVVGSTKVLFSALSQFIKDPGLAFQAPQVYLKLTVPPFQVDHGVLKWRIDWLARQAAGEELQPSPEPPPIDPALFSKIHESRKTSLLRKGRTIGEAVSQSAVGAVASAGGVDHLQESAIAVFSAPVERVRAIKDIFGKAATMLQGPELQDPLKGLEDTRARVARSLGLLEPLLPELQKMDK